MNNNSSVIKTNTSIDNECVKHTETFKMNQLIECHKTYTTNETHEIVMKYEHLLPRYDTNDITVEEEEAEEGKGGTGANEGIGPRYCPSIHIKVKRFPHRYL